MKNAFWITLSDRDEPETTIRAKFFGENPQEALAEAGKVFDLTEATSINIEKE